MIEIRIETEGLTFKEARELEAVIASTGDIERVQLLPFLPGTVQKRSFPIQAGLSTLHLMIRLTEKGAEGAAAGIGLAAAQHAYKRIGEALVDKAWNAIKGKLTGQSSVEVGVKLYGPDGQLIKKHEGRR